ncbi:hypothetical protein ACX0G9_21225 [Flavitalea flava]
MPSDLESSIVFLEETNNASKAYFSFTVDETGENGIIKANKEGLRLYAAEILKKSVLLENNPNGEPLFFGRLEWVISEAGYDLISCVHPQYHTRKEILAADRNKPHYLNLEEDNAAASAETPQLSQKGCLFSLLFWMASGLLLYATVKALPKLQAWVNIH